MSRADLITIESKRPRWSLSPPLCVLEAYSLLMDMARIRLASALTSIGVAVLIVFRCILRHGSIWYFHRRLRE